jgi:5'-3' exonuclease
MINIKCSVSDNQEIKPDLLEMHKFTGFDNVATYFRVGNIGALKMLQHYKFSLENW